jgi:hypothetical protein
LDRAVANDEWRGKFPAMRVINGDPQHSDHQTVIILTESEQQTRRGRGGIFGSRQAGWDRRIVEIWSRCGRSRGRGRWICGGRAEIGSRRFRNWSTNVLGDLEKRMKKLKKELEGCRRSLISQGQVAQEAILRYRLERVEEQIDVYWKQRAHVRWLQEGDRNTAFFHAACSERRRMNRIGRLKKEDGS